MNWMEVFRYTVIELVILAMVFPGLLVAFQHSREEKRREEEKKVRKRAKKERKRLKAAAAS